MQSTMNSRSCIWATSPPSHMAAWPQQIWSSRRGYRGHRLQRLGGDRHLVPSSPTRPSSARRYQRGRHRRRPDFRGHLSAVDHHGDATRATGQRRRGTTGEGDLRTKHHARRSRAARKSRNTAIHRPSAIESRRISQLNCAISRRPARRTAILRAYFVRPYAKEQDMNQPTALVTGGSRGIGLAIVRS